MIKAYLKAIFRALATPAVKLPFVLKDIAPRKSSNIADCQPPLNNGIKKFMEKI